MRPATEIGPYRIDPVIDGEGRLRPADVFPAVRPEDWVPYRSMLDEEGMLPICIGGFLVRGGGRTVLVDLGYGPGALGDTPTGRMRASLRLLGVDPGEVDVVLFTHLHADHVGWASLDGRPQFPNATFHCRPEDYAHFVVGRHDATVAERLLPCEGQFESVDETSRLLPGLTVLHTPGHTPGSLTLVFSAGRQRVVLLGDVAHCPVQLIEDGWSTSYDLDPEEAARTRRAVLGGLAGDPSLLLAGIHFPGMRLGRLLEVEGRRQWVV